MAEIKDLTIAPFWKGCEDSQGHADSLGGLAEGNTNVQVQPSSGIKGFTLKPSFEIQFQTQSASFGWSYSWCHFKWVVSHYFCNFLVELLTMSFACLVLIM